MPNSRRTIVAALTIAMVFCVTGFAATAWAAPVPAADQTTKPVKGTCTCQGTVSLKIDALSDKFNEYCASVKQYCSCDGTTATCDNIPPFPATEEECTALGTDPWGALQKAGGVSSGQLLIAKLALDVQATCSWSTGAAGAAVAPGRYGLMSWDPLRGKSIPALINGVVRVALGVVGALFFAVLIYGGIMWMIAGGEAERVKTAQKAITNAVIGIAVVFASYFLVSFLIRLSTTVQTPPKVTTPAVK